MKLQSTSTRGIANRRTVLKGIGATLAGGAVLGGTAAGQPGYPPHNRNITTSTGEGVDFTGDTGDDLWTTATVNKAGKPISLGIWLTGEGFDYLTGLPDGAHFDLDFPAVDGLTYTFAGIHWNPAGHPPAGVWTVPHFDFHYYFVDEAEVEAIAPPTPSPLPFMGVATYDVPATQMPPNYVYETPRFIVTEMGEHLYDETSPEFHPGGEFTHTYIYGAYDPAIDPSAPDGTIMLPLGPDGSLVELPTYEGDGTGELTFTEPMITEAFLRSAAFHDSGEVRVPVETPEVFPVAGYYPTEYVMRYLEGHDAYVISLEGLEWFDADAA